MTRIMIVLLLVAAGLTQGCATISHPEYDSRNAYTYYCVPGSAVKRRVPNGAVYPDWMLWTNGTCKHR